MKILFTGASSPTGMHMIQELVAGGHEVTATIRKPAEQYEGLKKERLDQIKDICKLVITPAFGDESFMKLITEEKWDVVCHHAADASNPQSPDFDWESALKGNTQNVRKIVETLVANGCKGLIMTGSIYEANEGVGTEPREAFSPYGLSKSLTWETFRYYSQAYGLKIGKFTIPIPIGPTEDPKMTTYLIKCWFKGEVPKILNPYYVRDYIPLSLMAKAYTAFLTRFLKGEADKANPSCYAMSNREFAKFFATEMEPRIGVKCPLEFADPTVFPEPMIRVNNLYLDPKELGWDEKKAWDDLAKFYLDHYN